ncbi:hypothetical protein PTTG_27747 [Puccinia triticina 1-1 BBBD Race 1]|uniref:rRNA adenine N(6)-methyltransferase n=1 Tax=Puccinia triticina (isolate 1-1 / race 1 (BBBD)) TaxID=630390 RepID=A0A180GI49_PUCT1|nr:hypothetical protein PTTG_27747 [Puccinia triticina 1-1 BBBD Race 1]
MGWTGLGFAGVFAEHQPLLPGDATVPADPSRRKGDRQAADAEDEQAQACRGPSEDACGAGRARGGGGRRGRAGELQWPGAFGVLLGGQPLGGLRLHPLLLLLPITPGPASSSPDGRPPRQHPSAHKHLPGRRQDRHPLHPRRIPPLHPRLLGPGRPQWPHLLQERPPDEGHPRLRTMAQETRLSPGPPAPATPSKAVLSHRKELDERPSIADPTIVQKLINQFWSINQLKDATILVSYAGYPTLIDELLKLKNVKKVIAIEEKPEYCIMYSDRWKAEIENKRLFHIKNDGYWWESYSEVEEEGLLDDVPIEEWEKSHPSLFFICQLPHNKRSIQFLMQLISFIPNRNWLFQYGRVGMGFLGSGELCQRMTRDQSEKKYTRITAAANCLTTIKTPAAALMDELTGAEFFPTNLELSGCSSTAKAGPSGRRLGRPPKAASSTAAASAKTTKKIYKSSPEANPTAFAAALDLRPKHDVLLSSDEFECLSFLQRVMFIHSAQSWVEGISHAAAGAAILYDKLLEIDRKRKPGQPPVSIPKSKTPRSFSDQDWIVLAKEFNRWPFRPRSFENDLELDSDDGPGT